MLSDAEFALIAREVKLRSGYALTRDLGPSIETRLMALQRRENLTSAGELIAAARNDGRLWIAITDALAAVETRFFRDRALFAMLRSEIAPALLARRSGARLKIWSAGCSTGQEPYSLSIMMEGLRAEGMAGGDIVATDFSERLLDKARAGLFTQFEVQRGLPIRTLITHFEKVSELWRVQDRFRALVRFERHNLLEDAAGVGEFDLVLCCNVLGGFDPASRQTALENIASALAPDGVLAIGSGETLDCVRDAFTLHSGAVYRRNAAWRKAA